MLRSIVRSSTPLICPLRPALSIGVRHLSKKSVNLHQQMEAVLAFPSVHALNDRKVDMLPDLHKKGIFPVGHGTFPLIPACRARDCLEIILENKMMLIGVNAYTNHPLSRRIIHAKEWDLDLGNLIEGYKGDPEKLMRKCASLADSWLSKNKQKDIHYYSFITTEDWKIEKETDKDRLATLFANYRQKAGLNLADNNNKAFILHEQNPTDLFFTERE
eukprot:TRINITY_DN2679_c0_g1_i1.p1 TRINITY_DN2679_c0_g1~~TRINITY_DN2679_c0_g1_i1.p1  ORF type:complete len:217 (+),score=40.41 TRINITY_DN2679_c0_g1_i1:116-766(+)